MGDLLFYFVLFSPVLSKAAGAIFFLTAYFLNQFRILNPRNFYLVAILVSTLSAFYHILSGHKPQIIWSSIYEGSQVFIFMALSLCVGIFSWNCSVKRHNKSQNNAPLGRDAAEDAAPV